ncbi:MAG: MazG nucleotide pyrophosphohydrolase domain-containing protein [Candidatus Hermodarchaeota archaeon]
MKVSEFQKLIAQLYLKKDKKRGLQKTFTWLVEEIGELASLIKLSEVNITSIKDELADIIAWTVSVANILDIDIEEALIDKYPYRCSKCNSSPCKCNEEN